MRFRSFRVTKLILYICVIYELSLICSARRKDKQHRSVSPGRNGLDGVRKRNYPKEFPLTNVADDDVDDDEMYDVMGPDEAINLSTNNESCFKIRLCVQAAVTWSHVNLICLLQIMAKLLQELDKQRRKRIDPKGSWFTFVKYSEDRTGDRQSDKRKKKRKRKQRSKTLHGPQGPAGPPGPPGPPGSSFTKEEILADLQTLIKEAAEQRAKELVADMVDTTAANRTSLPELHDVTSEFLSIPKIYAGFTMRLKEKENVHRKSLKEIKKFEQPFGPGNFQRGGAFNTEIGRFVAPREGVYHFTTNLRVKVRTNKKHRVRETDSVEVSICIDSLCKTNTSISTITGITKHRQLFTTTVTGTLYLQENQYTSVYVNNASPFKIKILAGSEYSGLFLGV